MERIENILRRLQEVYYSRHEKTTIDIDLMLDYTRVMYADLLEWRKRFKEETAPEPEPAAETPVPPAATAPVEKEQQPQPVATTPVEKQEQPQQEAPEQQEITENKTPVHEDTVAGPEKEEAEAGVVQEVLQNNSSAISFEPPAAQLPPHAAEIEDVLTEEEPVMNVPVENIVLPAVEPVAPETLAPPATAQPAKGPVLRKDIRGAIGINDKYLFLNELFGNNKTDYEEALDQLRLFDNYEQAYQWLHAHPARKNSWEEGDDTVQSFLALVNQYLSSK